MLFFLSICIMHCVCVMCVYCTYRDVYVIYSEFCACAILTESNRTWHQASLLFLA